MDLSKFATEDLQALRSKNLGGMSDEGLKNLRGQTAAAAPEEAPEPETTGSIGRKLLMGVAKAGDVVRAHTTGPLIGSALEMMTGKKAYDGSEVSDAHDPTSLKSFPSVSEMMARTGVKNPKLSDALPGYAEPGKSQHWYQPEKGGMLDPSVGGFVNIASDPAMWTGAGEVGAAAKVLKANAAAKAGLLSQGLSMAAAPVKAAGRVAGAVTGARPIASAIDLGMTGLNSIPKVGGALAKGAEIAMNPVGTVVQEVGRALYGAPLLPMKQYADEFGGSKGNVINDVYNSGITNPIGLRAKMYDAQQALARAKNNLITQAGDAKGDIMGALTPLMEERNKLAAITHPEAKKAVEEIDKIISEYVHDAVGVPSRPTTPFIPGRPAVPPSFAQQPSAILDEFGKPIMKDVQVSAGRAAVPATPAGPWTRGVPGKNFNAKAMDQEKQAFAMQPPTSSWKPGAPRTNYEVAADKAGARGFRQETERLVGQEVGPEAADALADINRAYGGATVSRTGQNVSSRQADRLLHATVAPTGMDAVMQSLSWSRGGPEEALKAGMAQKLGYAARLGSMPAGYGLRKLGDAKLSDRLLNTLQKKKHNTLIFKDGMTIKAGEKENDHE